MDYSISNVIVFPKDSKVDHMGSGLICTTLHVKCDGTLDL